MLSLCVTAANYDLFTSPVAIAKLVNITVMFAGGFVLFKENLTALCCVSAFTSPIQRKTTVNLSPQFLYAVSFTLIVSVYLFVFFATEYPGILTYDSIHQLYQVFGIEAYSNHHPFFHTQIIKLLLLLGFKLFGEINAAIATYSVFSVLIMASCFSYTICTIYQYNHSKGISIVVLLCYMFLPYHIKYSYTMWKDVFFGASVLVYVVAVFRILEEIGKHAWANYVTMIAGAFGMSLMRSNGFLAFFVSAVIFALMFGKRFKIVVLLLMGVVVLSFVMKYPLLKTMGVSQPDTIESLSIPAQQIARAITDGAELTDKQRILLEQIVDVERIPESYNRILSDPIKELVRAKDNQEYLQESKFEYIKLYLELGLKYPREFIKGWIDQTRGFWNAGYSFTIWSEGIYYDNSLGLGRIINSCEVKELWDRYLEEFGADSNNPILQLFCSIGFNLWIMLAASCYALTNKRYTALYVSIPTFIVLATLLVATPVFCEFRYFYSLFCCLPFIVCTSFTEFSKV